MIVITMTEVNFEGFFSLAHVLHDNISERFVAFTAAIHQGAMQRLFWLLFQDYIVLSILI